MFYLSCREMAPTLQNVAFLSGFPYAGFPLAAHDVPATWCTEFLTRFQGVLPPNTDYIQLFQELHLTRDELKKPSVHHN